MRSASSLVSANLSPEFDYHPEPGWHADEANYFEPDFLLGPAGFDRTSIRPAHVALLIEVAHSSLAFDTTTKAGQYCGAGVREYWVVNAVTLARVFIARRPSEAT